MRDSRVAPGHPSHTVMAWTVVDKGPNQKPFFGLSQCGTPMGNKAYTEDVTFQCFKKEKFKKVSGYTFCLQHF